MNNTTKNILIEGLIRTAVIAATILSMVIGQQTGKLLGISASNPAPSIIALALFYIAVFTSLKRIRV